MRPLAVDLFTGLHGWAEGLTAEGFDVIGFDLEDMCAQFGAKRPDHVQLVIQDVLTLHGSQFKDAALIVASPPCQEFSYMAMPWTRAKQRAAEYRAGVRDVKDLTRLFDACFRIQREASGAAGHHIPLVVENVRGAIPWVGRSRGNVGPYHLWGDVPALMPAFRAPKQAGHWFKDSGSASGSARFASKSPQRKEWSAMIAKIPLPLSRWIAATYYPNVAFHDALQIPRACVSAANRDTRHRITYVR